MSAAPASRPVVFTVRSACSFAGHVLPAGAIVVVRHGHPTRPITVVVELPPEFGDLAELTHRGVLEPCPA
jgi:hypothetical protein